MRAEYVALGIAVAALGAAIVASNNKVVAGVLTSVSPADFASGPAYLVGNQPWFFGAPSTGIMPTLGRQQEGASNPPAPEFYGASGCGCS